MHKTMLANKIAPAFKAMLRDCLNGNNNNVEIMILTDSKTNKFKEDELLWVIIPGWISIKVFKHYVQYSYVKWHFIRSQDDIGNWDWVDCDNLKIDMADPEYFEKCAVELKKVIEIAYTDRQKELDKRYWAMFKKE